MFAIGFPAIDPIALEAGPIVIRWYSLAYVAGILLGWRYIVVLTVKANNGVKRIQIDDFIIWATFGIILGGRLGYVIFYKPTFFVENPLLVLAMWNGGMSFHGGLIGMTIVMWLFVRQRGLTFIALGDLICAAAPIGIFFGRIANFINGELFGRESNVPWAMVFPRGGPNTRHPSQLYEAGLEGLVLFCILSVMIFRFKALQKRGIISGTFLTGYGLSRYLVEFIRQPDTHLGMLFGIATMGQLLSLPLLAIGIWLISKPYRQS